jgi:sn-glycerol 3-phosphate transport system ATP-binding protein
LDDGQSVVPFTQRGEYLLGVRPEDISVLTEGSLEAQFRYREDLGSHTIVAAELAGETLRIATPFGAAFDPEPKFRFSLPTSRLHLFDGTTGEALSTSFKSENP